MKTLVLNGQAGDQIEVPASKSQIQNKKARKRKAKTVEDVQRKLAEHFGPFDLVQPDLLCKKQGYLRFHFNKHGNIKAVDIYWHVECFGIVPWIAVELARILTASTYINANQIYFNLFDTVSKIYGSYSGTDDADTRLDEYSNGEVDLSISYSLHVDDYDHTKTFIDYLNSLYAKEGNVHSQQAVQP